MGEDRLRGHMTARPPPPPRPVPPRARPLPGPGEETGRF